MTSHIRSNHVLTVALSMLLLLLASDQIESFSSPFHWKSKPIRQESQCQQSLLFHATSSRVIVHHNNVVVALSSDQNQAEESTLPQALPPSSSTDDSSEEDILLSTLSSSSSSSVATMINQETKRILIEELGYRRVDVDKLRFELAGPIVEKRLRCPSEGIPDSWCRSPEDLSMMEKLENENKYPFKIPLLGISLILFGKGFGDAFITIIKVNTNFPGATLTEEFLGIPVLLIDAICVVVGAAIGTWTWKNMK